MDCLVKIEACTIFPVKVEKVAAICSCEKKTLESMMKTYRMCA